MTGRGAPARAAFLLAISVAACAQLFDDPIQCHADADCAHFGAVCDVASGVCVNSSVSASGGTGGAGDAAPGTATAPDATVPAEASVDPQSDACKANPKPTATVGAKIPGDPNGASEIPTSTTLGCDKDWILDGRVLVRSTATLTVSPGTTIRAKKGVSAGLVVSQGARLVAQGTRDAPVVFTSDDPNPTPGDWRGVVLLGQAPPQGLPPLNGDPALSFGGGDAADGSGALAFVRIEYATQGLLLAGAGTGTQIDSVEVWRSSGDCFTFSGGTASAKHLVCQHPGDDQFEYNLGYTGRTQFLFGQKSAPQAPQQANGFLIDGAHPLIFNATICGDSPNAPGDGLVFRDGATVDIVNTILTGWTAGVDATGDVPNPGALRRSILFGNTNNPAFVEDDTTTDPSSPLFNDDNGFDEIAWVVATGRLNSLDDPGLVACFDGATPKPWPATSLATNAATPPTDGFFDPTAKFIGAFKDATDGWMSGGWVRFTGP